MQKKVLLVCLDNLGDLVFTSALAAALAQDPKIHLALFCKDYTAPLGTLLPGVQQVFAADPFWDKAPGRSKGSFWAFIICMLAIRRQGFAQVLIPSSCWKTALFLRLAGIPQRIGLAGRKNKPFLSVVLSPPKRTEPVVQGLLKSFQDYLPSGAPPTTALVHDKLRDLPQLLQAKPYLCIHAFAGRRDRCAPVEFLRRLASKMQEAGLPTLWMGTPSELDELRSLGVDGLYADQFARSLFDITALIRRAQFFIGHDSGPLHVAGALGIPVLGFYLPGEPKRTLPQGVGPAILVARSGPQDLDASLLDIASEQILEMLRKPLVPGMLLRL